MTDDNEESGGYMPDGRSNRGVWSIPLGRRRSLGRSGTLLVSRFAEQVALGGATFLLAWRLGVEGFAPVSALLILNSLAVTASDLGLGTEVLRKPRGTIAAGARWTMRWVNLSILIGGTLGALVLLDGDARLLVVGSVIIWFLAAEAQVGKSAALATQRASSASMAEILGSALVAVGVLGAITVPEQALLVMVLALAGKHVFEAIWVRHSSDVFKKVGSRRWKPSIWVGRILSYTVGNVDYLIVGVLFSAEIFSIYTLAFRVASFAMAQVSYVVGRVALVDFGTSATPERLETNYQNRVRQLFWWGAVAALGTIVVAPALPWVLGPEWQHLTGVVVVLAISTPWRMTAGLGGIIGLAVDQSRRLARWEATRLLLYVLVLVGSAQLGFPWFVIAAALGAIVTSVAYDAFARKFARVTGSRPVRLLAPVGVVCSTIATLLLVSTY